MLCKYYLQLGTATVDTSSADCIDVSAMIKNLDAIKVSYQRVDLGGVVRKCGSTIEFTGKAYDAIIAHYSENYLQSSGAFAVFIADNKWNYSKAWECPLDFATLQYDANVCTIGCVDNSAAAVIKANKKSKYEFDVSSLRDSSLLRYDGVLQQKTITFSVVGDAGEGDEQHDNDDGFYLFNYGWYSIYAPGIGVSSNDTIEGLEIFDQTQCSVDYYQTSGFTPDYINDESSAVSRAMELESRLGFIRCTTNRTVHINMSMTFKVLSWGEQPWGIQYDMDWDCFCEYNFLLVAGNRIVWRKAATVGDNVININQGVQLYAGEKLAFMVSVRDTEGIYLMGDPSLEAIPYKIGLRWYSNSHQAYTNESSYSDNPKTIHAIKPLSLLKSLASSMVGGSRELWFDCVIDNDVSLTSRTLLLAADSIRNLTNSKITTSFVDFCKFMEVVYGYVYTLKEGVYLMDRELQEYDEGTRQTISHIRASILTSQKWTPHGVDFGTHDRMYRCSSVIREDLGDLLDLETEYSGNWYNANVIYNEYANVFVVKDNATGKYYANFVGDNLYVDGSMFNDETGHAREMIGLQFYDKTHYNRFLYAIIRNGKIIFCDAIHPIGWLDNAENNTECVELRFKHRSSVFKQDVIKRLSSVSNISYQIDDSIIYGDIEVGYTKKDYDNANSAKNEFNFTNYYKTDNNISDNSLSLICPYRADCYGIEELLIKNTSSGGSDSELTSSDNDVFIVITKSSAPVSNRWEIDRTAVVQNAYTNTVFNAAIAPNKIILNNEDYIGCFVKELLKFTSSDGNSRAIIGDMAMSADIPITKQLFKAGKISVDTDDHNFPENWEGLIEFEYAGKTYKGYLDSIDISFANTGTITYNLIEKCIE